MNRTLLLSLGLAIASPALSQAADTKPPGLPENLAPKARITTTSTYNYDYQAKFVADGAIPEALSQQDTGVAWCVKGDTHRGGAEIAFAWAEPVTVAEVIYYGRTAWFIEECWKDLALFADGAEKPAATGQLEMRHGPQRIRLPALTKTSKLTLKFTSSYGGPNPGASEIQVFASSPSERELQKLVRGNAPPVDEVDGESLRALIGELKQTHGAQYAPAGEHLEALRQLESEAAAGRDVADQLARLQREVLLFDVTRLLVLQRHEIESSHVYTYHNEGFRAGGGLYLVSVNRGGATETERTLTPALSLSEREKGNRSRRTDKPPRTDTSLRPDNSTRNVTSSAGKRALPLPRFGGEGRGEGALNKPTTTANTSAVQLVSSPSGQILDCDLSYDGKTVLFSWRQGENEGYHLWTMHIDGTGLRQLTHGEWHDYNGCWLPDGGIAFVSTRNAQFAYCWNSPVGVVHRMDADGANVRRLSANYLNDFTPYPLDDGRLIYSRWEYVDKPAIPIQSLWTINPDGTGLAGYYGNRVISPGTFMEARSIPGTDLILCTMTGHNGGARGAIGVIDRTRGVNAQEAIWNVTPDVAVPPVEKGDGNFWGSKPYCTPVPLDKHRFLVSARGPVLVRDFSGTCQSLVLPKPEKGMQWFCAQPVRERAKPANVPRSTVSFASLQSHRSADFQSAVSQVSNLRAPESSRASIADSRPADWKSATQQIGNPRYESAYLYLQDIYQGLEPRVKRGEVKRLRVVREMPKTVRINPDKRAFGFQFPVISAGATYAGKDVIGEVDIEPDGSAYFEVPAGVPIYFMALDVEGRAVQRMRSFTHLMPGEVQGCIGCHTDRGRNTPMPSRAASMSRPFKKLEPPEWGAGGFDYAAIVQPVLDKHCAKCHSGPTPDGKVDLSGDQTDYFNVSYETLARGRKQWGEAQYESPYVSWIPSYNGFETNILHVAPKAWGSPQSKLADLLLDGHPDHEGKSRLKMTAAERRRVLAWIDLNVPYYGSSETTHPDNPGSRRIYPPELDTTLASVAARRCAECHKDGKVPRPFWTRITNPLLNNFLLAPLPKEAGGTGACGKPVFASADDPDYQAILRTFDAPLAELVRTPRLDMPGAKASLAVNRSCK